MRNVWTIAVRELKLFFISPIAYVMSVIMLLILGGIFFLNLYIAINTQQFTPGMDVIIQWAFILFLFTIPAFTMRTLAEENKTGTLELLLTAPVRDWEVIVGKWLGGMLYIISFLVITWVYPVILNQLVKPGIDQGLLLSSYLGLLLAASAFIAIGVATSSMFNNQIASFFASLGIFLILWLLIGAPADVVYGTPGDILRYLSMRDHFSPFVTGIISIQDITYFLSLTALGLFFGTVSIESRRWR
jgi:ABC-2 type transport system permease protein